MPQLSLVKERGNLRLNGITSEKIHSLLCEKHRDDVFIPECKNGETWGARDLLKLDAWVLLRTYSPLTTIGYEIKVSRQDFEQDQKWASYLDLCHLFYFVCPAGMIRAVDLPSRVGLIWVSSTGKLHTKHKAEREHPDIEKLNRLLIYVVMARSKIVDNMYEINKEPPKGNLQLLKEAVEHASEKKELAYFVKGHIRDIYTRIEKQDKELKYREDGVKRFEEHLKRLGITWDSNTSSWQDNMRVENEIGLLKKQIDRYSLDQMRQLARQLIAVTEVIERYHAQGQEVRNDNIRS